MTFTCLIPVYNTPGAFLKESVDSMLNQSFQDFGIIIIDDGSTLEETKMMFYELVKNPRVTVLGFETNKGTPSALNFGHSIIATDYTILMGSDDISHPDRIKLQVEYLKAHPETDVIGTWLTAFKQSTGENWFKFEHRESPVPNMYPRIHHRYFMVNHGTVIYRNSAVKKVGGYDPLHLRGQDVFLWEKMWNAGCVFRNVTKHLYRFRRPKD